MSGVPSLDSIPGVWRGKTVPRVAAVPTGFAGLDALLPGGGWPVGALSEILHTEPGLGELQLVMPLLARLTEAGGRVALSGPPHVPYAPAFAAAGIVLSRLLITSPPDPREALWGVEQILRSATFGAVIGWIRTATDHELRRLQLSAEEGCAIGVLMRPLGAGEQLSPAALRLELKAQSGSAVFSVRVLKARGGNAGATWTSG